MKTPILTPYGLTSHKRSQNLENLVGRLRQVRL